MSKKLRIVISVILSVIVFIILGIFTLSSMLGAMFTTSDYRVAEAIYNRSEKGKSYTKDKILSKMGYPDSCYDSEGNVYRYRDYGRDDAKSYEAIIFDESIVRWSYSFYELRDPANPCSLQVTFNSSGKSIDIDMRYVPGG